MASSQKIEQVTMPARC